MNFWKKNYANTHSNCLYFVTATKKLFTLTFAGLFFFLLLFLYYFTTVAPTAAACWCIRDLCSVLCFVSYPDLKGVWKYWMFLLHGPTWSTGDTGYLLQKEASSPSVSCKGSFLQKEPRQQTPNTQGNPGSPKLKCSKCIDRESQPHCLRSLAQTESIRSVSELSFICCINTVLCTALLTKSLHR